MPALRGALYAVSALLMLSIVLVFLPWGALNALMRPFAPAAYPDAPLVQYTVKVLFFLIFWLGVLLAVAVRRPGPLERVLLVLGATLVSTGVLCLALGWAYGVPWFFYLDALFSVVFGGLVLAYRARLPRPGEAGR